MAKPQKPVEVDPNVEMPNLPEGWVFDEIGYPPYWTPEVGKRMVVEVLARDDTGLQVSGGFVRYLLKSCHAIKCLKGPSDNAEEVVLDAGKKFTMSLYAALPMDDYFGYQVYLEVTGKRDVPKGTMWEWKVGFTPAVRAQIEARRTQALTTGDNPAALQS